MMRALWCDAIDGERTEFRILFADRPEFLELCRIAIGLILFHAIPELDGGALWGLPIERSHLSGASSSRSSDCQEASAGFLDERLLLRGVLPSVGVGIRHIDFTHE